MEFQKISSPSLRDLFIEQLEHLILSGKLQVGEKLPPERQLAEMMQVSRAVVNSGISELEKKGFLTVKPRSGTYVADFRRKGTLDTLIAIMNYNGGRMRDQEIRSIFERIPTRVCPNFRKYIDSTYFPVFPSTDF